jgi:RimJ/RimL family protein N-acetyltransferase
VSGEFPQRIATERLILRRWTRDDRDAFLAIWSDPGVWQSLRPGTDYEPAFAEARFEHHLGHWDEHGFGLFAVRELESDETAGWIGPAHPDFIPELEHEVELGWTLRRAFWGRALATEGARAAAAASFERLRVERVISLIHPANSRSQAVAHRIGMSHAGDVVHHGIGEELRVYELMGVS